MQNLEEIKNLVGGITGNENPQVSEISIKLNNQQEIINDESGFYLLRFRGVDCQAGTMLISYKGRTILQVQEKNFDTGETLLLCDEIDAIAYDGNTGTAIAEGYFCKYSDQ